MKYPVMGLSSSVALKIALIGCIIGTILSVRPNIIIILADDLGYGDLGWSPFNSDLTKNIQAPNLKAMAKNGMIMSNFHTASPLCSPSRASIMVGLFPWRFGVDFIYAGDLKLDGSEEMDHEQLPLVPNIAMSFHDAGYYTAHIGKWHLGGQSHIEIPARKASNCNVPGINQYGFDEYVGMSEGTNSMRYWTHQRKETYHAGSKYLFRNDVPLKAREEKEILTDRQAEEAMRVITEQTQAHRPFFLNLWFDAPHSPWEPIEPFFSQYSGKFSTPMLQKYASMVSNMDMNIGRLLRHLDDLGIANNTLVVFTSDNGPENEAGSPGPFKGRKRLLSEGGIRVPTIVQWKGRIPAGATSDLFMLTTDLWPTLTEAAGISMPPHNRIDGVSLLPRLLQPTAELRGSTRGLHYGDERTVLWYTHSIGFPKLTAAWSHGFKVLWNDYEGRKSKNMPAPFRLFDMRRDPTENVDLMPLVTATGECNTYKRSAGTRVEKELTWLDIVEGHGNGSASRQFKQAALHLLNHLHIKMHLFRHEGELDWTRYHVNKPYETDPHCGIRRSLEVDPFPFSNSLQVPPPEFCGKGVYQQYWGVSCRCAPQQCDNLWTLGSSAGSGGSAASSNVLTSLSQDLVRYFRRGQPIPEGLAYLAPESGTLVSYTRTELQKWTDFQPRCEGSDVLAESSHQVVAVSTPKQCPSLVDPDTFMTLKATSGKSGKGSSKCDLPEREWALGNVVQQHKWLRSCHQRVAMDASSNSTTIYLQPNSCGFDYPVLTIATHGMVPTYLSLCPESLSNFHNKRGGSSSSGEGTFMDDNVMMVAMNLLLLNEVSPVHSPRAATDGKADQDEEGVLVGAPKSPTPFVASGVVKDVAIVDPLFFHSLGLTSRHSLTTLHSPAGEVHLSLDRKGVAKTVQQLWGFLAPYERRLSNSASGTHQIEYLVFPVYQELVWSIAVVHHLRSSTTPPSIIYFDTLSGGRARSSSSSTVMASVVQQVVSEVVRKCRHSEESVLLPITVMSPVDKPSNSCGEQETSGLKVLLFLKNLKEAVKNSVQLSADVLLKNVNNHFAEIERKALMTYVSAQSKRDYGRRKRYLKNMSSKKMQQK